MWLSFRWKSDYWIVPAGLGNWNWRHGSGQFWKIRFAW